MRTTLFLLGAVAVLLTLLSDILQLGAAVTHFLATGCIITFGVLLIVMVWKAREDR